MANNAQREKGSPYRISEITISATIPPGVNFAIGRIDDPEAAAAADLHKLDRAARRRSCGGRDRLARRRG